MPAPTSWTARGLLVALASVALLSACAGGSATGQASSTARPVTTPTAAAKPTPTPTPTPPARSVLSGRLGEADGPVLVVKLDNTHHAAPHAGLTAADVVYVEEVEYGITRYAAVYSTRLPAAVGPIRSARITDVDLLAQYGRVAFAYSGAQTRLRPVLAAASFYDVSGDRSGVGYWRQRGRPAPYDFFGDPARLLARAPKAATARDVGFRFSDAVPVGGTPAPVVTVTYPSARFGLTWSAGERRWLVTLDGRKAMAAEGGRLGGTTVIVQYVRVHPSGYGDKFGGVTPMSETVGQGKALVLRDGLAYQAAWSRPAKSGGTRFTVADRDLPLAPGQVWVFLVRSSRPATIG